MRKLFIFIIISLSVIFSAEGQDYNRTTNFAHNYYSSPGFVNIAELSGALGFEDVCAENSWYYLGATNIFGYQMTRNVICGAGLGFYQFDKSAMIPVFMEFRYTKYMMSVNPFFYGDGGILFDLKEPDKGSKIFINPGFGISRSITPKIEATMGAGLMIQMGDAVDRTSFINVKAGLIFRKQGMRLYKPTTNGKNNDPYK